MNEPAADFLRRLEAVSAATDKFLQASLTEAPLAGEIARPARLLAAMRKATEGGKRLRPFLVIETAALFGVPEQHALPAAAAFECVHCYSLVHDDLPSMDDDDLRRGQPTIHRAFDEATAILAGDALLTLAFDLLARDTTHAEPAIRVALVQLLARASGLGGMAGGQALDLEAEGRFSPGERALPLAIGEIERLQAMKTGALLAGACEAGAILGKAKPVEREALQKYARAFGIAFQIADDLLDAEGDPARLGKNVGKDEGRGKATLVAKLGAAEARKHLESHVAEAEAALSPFGRRAAMLQAAARFVAARQH